MVAVLRILLVVFAIYLVLLLFVFVFQEKMVYFPYKAIRQFPSNIGLPYREVILKTSDGIRVHGWLVGNRDKTDRDVVLFCHGKALFEAAGSPKQFLQLSGSHNEGFWQSGQIYIEGLYQFLHQIKQQMD